MIKILFYLFNVIRYNKLSFSANIVNPLRIDGHKYISLNKNVTVNELTWIIAAKVDDIDPVMVFSEGCDIGAFNHIAAVRKVIVGENVKTEQRVFITDSTHVFENINIPIINQSIRYLSEVIIGKGSYLGANVCVIGANVGRNCVIEANSVVTKDIPDYCVAEGIPAKVIKRYNVLTQTWEEVL